MRLIVRVMLAAFASCLTVSPAICATPFEQQVLATLNEIRQDPGLGARMLRQYRRFFHAKLVSVPGAVTLVTQEGVAPVNEAIAFLDRQAQRAPLRSADLLTDGAADHVAEQASDGSIGHAGRDGSAPGDRVRRHGGDIYVAEVITYGPRSAADVVQALVVDDGVPDRGHRSVIFDPRLRFAGVSCGPHPAFGTMCVVDLAETPDGRAPGAARSIQMADISSLRYARTRN